MGRTQPSVTFEFSALPFLQELPELHKGSYCSTSMTSASAVTTAKVWARNGARRASSVQGSCLGSVCRESDHQALVVAKGNRIPYPFTHAITFGRQYDLAQYLVFGKVRLDGIGAKI